MRTNLTRGKVRSKMPGSNPTWGVSLNEKEVIYKKNYVIINKKLINNKK